MRSRTSRATSGLPGLPCLLFQVQYRRNPRRCQAIAVSGLTMMSAERQPDHRCSSHAHKRRSSSVSRTRPRCDLRSTLIWWWRARISSCRAARVWKQERRVPRKERNRVSIGSAKLSSRSEPKSIISMRTEFLAGTPDQKTWFGRRDHALLLVAVQTGLRLSELTGLQRVDVSLGTGAHVRCVGKGRKERCTPLTKMTVAVLKAWLHEPARHGADALFPSAGGGRLSPDSVAGLLAKHVALACKSCPSLRKKHVTPHVLRHSMAMGLLQDRKSV